MQSQYVFRNKRLKNKIHHRQPIAESSAEREPSSDCEVKTPAGKHFSAYLQANKLLKHQGTIKLDCEHKFKSQLLGGIRVCVTVLLQNVLLK